MPPDEMKEMNPEEVPVVLAINTDPSGCRR
jgi:hypothetical protein